MQTVTKEAARVAPPEAELPTVGRKEQTLAYLRHRKSSMTTKNKAIRKDFQGPEAAQSSHLQVQASTMFHAIPFLHWCAADLEHQTFADA